MPKKPPLTAENWQDTKVRDVDELADTADLLENNKLATLGAVWEFLDHEGQIGAFDDAADLDHETVKVWFDAFFDANPTWRPAKQPSAQEQADQEEHEHYQQIRKAAERVAVLNSEWSDLKERASEAKKVYDGAAAELVFLIRNPPRTDPQLTLPFGDDAEPAEPLSAETSWEDSITTEQVGVPQAIRDKLETNQHPNGEPFPIKTYGDLTRWRIEYELTDVDGIGPGKATKVQELFDAYFAENQAPVAKPSKVKLLADLPHSDYVDAGGTEGAVLPISGWDGDCPVVKLAGDEITLDAEDCEAVA